MIQTAFLLEKEKGMNIEENGISVIGDDYSEKYKLDDVIVIKKSGEEQDFNVQKALNAIYKSAFRVGVTLTDDEKDKFCRILSDKAKETGMKKIPISVMHNIVELTLDELNSDVAKSYRDYRNYKHDFIHMMDEVYKKSQSVMYLGDKENANTDSALVSTKRSLVFNQLNKELYQKFSLTAEEMNAVRDGYIYIHDMSARRDTMNCCLANIKDILTGGFEMANVWYNEPKTLDVAFDVIGDIVLSAASQQYGGFTMPEVDKLLAPYAEKSYSKYIRKYTEKCNMDKAAAEKLAMEDVQKEMDQGFQGWEYKFNTVSSSRGDYPFITMTFGLGTEPFEKMASITCLNVRKKGQGKKGHKKPVLFPKLVFLYDENLHGEGKELEDVFEAGYKCSMKTMYPDWLSMSGEGYIASMYKKYGKVISPMGCVDGKEIITYKFNGNLFVESFERMWNRLTDNFEVKHQTKDSIHLYMDLENVSIYDTEKGFVNTKKIIRNVSSEWVDVHLSNGRRLLCTADHPLTTLNGETKRADSLNSSDSILINSSQYSDEKIVFNKDKAWLLGVILCDGCYQNNHISVSIAAKGEDEIEEKFHNTFGKYFGMKTKTILQKRGKKGTYKDLAAEADDQGSLQRTIAYLTSKFGGVSKVNRHIPNEVFEWDYCSKLAFLAGMIDADGYIDGHSHGGSVVSIGSTNKELALQQAALAQTLGMPARVYHNHYRKSSPEAVRYKVEFYPIEELLEYIVCNKKTEKYVPEVSGHYNTNANVFEVLPVDRTAYSYDVTTDSEHFEVSGIYSHNCRAFLSPWYEHGGMHPEDENDAPVFVGRFNIGAVSLHLPMYKDDYEGLIGNCDSFLFLGGQEPSTLKFLSEILGKATITVRNNSRSRGGKGSSSLSFNKTARSLMEQNELSKLDGDHCILLVRGLDPFYDRKYDLLKHPNYKYTGDNDTNLIYDYKQYFHNKLAGKQNRINPSMTTEMFKNNKTKDGNEIVGNITDLNVDDIMKKANVKSTDELKEKMSEFHESPNCSLVVESDSSDVTDTTEEWEFSVVD